MYMHSTCMYVYLLIEQDETQERTGHGPLTPAVLKHDYVHYRGEHLLEHVRVQLPKAQECGLACRGEGDGTLTLAQVLEQEGHNVVQGATTPSADSVV